MLLGIIVILFYKDRY